jgi:hypothetical protein
MSAAQNRFKQARGVEGLALAAPSLPGQAGSPRVAAYRSGPFRAAAPAANVGAT